MALSSKWYGSSAASEMVEVSRSYKRQNYRARLKLCRGTISTAKRSILAAVTENGKQVAVGGFGYDPGNVNDSRFLEIVPAKTWPSGFSGSDSPKLDKDRALVIGGSDGGFNVEGLNSVDVHDCSGTSVLYLNVGNLGLNKGADKELLLDDVVEAIKDSSVVANKDEMGGVSIVLASGKTIVIRRRQGLCSNLCAGSEQGYLLRPRHNLRS